MIVFKKYTLKFEEKVNEAQTRVIQNYYNKLSKIREINEYI